MDCTADTCRQQLHHTRHNSHDNGRRNICKIELLDQIDGTRRVSELLTRCVSACTDVELAIRSLLFYLVWHFLTTSNLKIANKSGVFHLQLASSHLKQSLPGDIFEIVYFVIKTNFLQIVQFSFKILFWLVVDYLLYKPIEVDFKWADSLTRIQCQYTSLYLIHKINAITIDSINLYIFLLQLLPHNTTYLPITSWLWLP